MSVDRQLLPAVDAAMHQIGAALRHADEFTLGNIPGYGQLVDALAVHATALDEALRCGDIDEIPWTPETVEWIVTAPTPADTLARAAVVLAVTLQEHTASQDLVPAEYYGVAAAFTLALQGAMAAGTPPPPTTGVRP